MKTLRRTFTTLTAFTALALLSGCGLSPEEKLTEAQESLAVNDYAGAKVYLVSALKDVPGDAETLTLLAQAQIAMGDGDGALVSLAQIAKEARSDAYSRHLAEAELLRGEYRAAIEALGILKSAQAARVAALAHLGLGDLDAAKQAIAAGQDMPGDKAGLLAVLARIQLGEEGADKARETAERALKANPDNIDALLVSARIHQAAYDLPAALSTYEKATGLYPQNFASQLGMAATLGEMGRLDEAKQAAQRLSEMAPKSLDVIHLKARIAIEEGEYQSAREMLQGYEAALREDPSKQATYATALLRVGQTAQALIWLEPLVENYPFLREPRALLAEAQLASGEPEAALATIRALADRPDARPDEIELAAKSARESGDSSAARYAAREGTATPEWFGGELAKADTALRNQQWRKAVTSYEAISARTSSPNAMVLNNLAYAKSKLGENEDAIRIALEAVSIAPDHAAILDTAGWILVETGKDRARGIEMLEKAAALDPDNTAIARRLTAAKQR